MNNTGLRTSSSPSFRDPTERLVNSHHARKHLRLALCNGLLCLQLGALGIEERKKVGDAFAIAGPGNRRRPNALTGLLVELHQTLLLFAVVDERILGLFERARPRLLIQRFRFACPRFRATQSCASAAEVESGPGKRRSHRPGMRVLLAEETPATGDQAKKPGDRDTRKEIGRGNPLASGGS